MSASCLYSPTIGAGQTERRMNVFPSPTVSLSPHPPTPQPPKAQASRHSTWPPLRLFICVRASQRSCSDRTKTSGRDEERQGRMWTEARGEQEELRTTGRSSTCANPETDNLLPCQRLEGPLGAERMHSTDVLRKPAF